MRILAGLGLCAMALLLIVGCNNQADVSPAEQKSYEMRDASKMKGPPPGWGPGGHNAGGSKPPAATPGAAAGAGTAK